MNPPHRGNIGAPSDQTWDQITDSFYLKRSNLMIFIMGYDLFFFNYYSSLSNPGLPRTLPFIPLYDIVYDERDD
jgi:hypothetical protein